MLTKSGRKRAETEITPPKHIGISMKQVCKKEGRSSEAYSVCTDVLQNGNFAGSITSRQMDIDMKQVCRMDDGNTASKIF